MENSVKVLKLCKWIGQSPVKSLIFMLTVQGISIILTILLYKLGSDPFPADFTDIPLQLTNDESYKRAMAWNQRNKDPLEPMYQPVFLNDHFVRHEIADVIELFYEVDGNVLKPAILLKIQEFENNITSLEHYNEFCVLDATEQCKAVQSLWSFMDIQCSEPSCPEMTQIPRKLQRIARSPSSSEIMQEHCAKDTNLHISPIQTHSLRSFLQLSWVSKGNERDSYEKVGRPKTTAEFATKIVHPYLWNNSISGLTTKDGQTINIYYYNRFLYLDKLRDQVLEDQFLAMGSFAFIFSFLLIQTKSLFISVFGMFGITSNFFAANLIYRYIFDYQYFGIFNVLSVFIILGIGVDDIFVFNDAWTATSSKVYINVESRLSDCYRKSSLSMLITSFTTTMAFVVNAFSPFLAISSFGIFSALLVVVNYISVVTYFPCVIAFHHRYFERRFSCCQDVSKGTNSPIISFQ